MKKSLVKEGPSHEFTFDEKAFKTTNFEYAENF